MMLPILISPSVAPGSYFFCAAAGSMLMERPSTIDASRMPRDCAMSTSLNAVGCLPIIGSLSRIAQLDQRTALPDQCLQSAEADVRPQGGTRLRPLLRKA